MLATLMAYLGSGLAKWGIVVILAVAAAGGTYWKGRTDGNTACVAEQDKRMAKLEAYVKKVRERVERNLPLDDDIMRADPFQREP